jgi:hypothetical protein
MKLRKLGLVVVLAAAWQTKAQDAKGGCRGLERFNTDMLAFLSKTLPHAG